MPQLSSKATLCLKAATQLGPEDTARFVELFDTYSAAGLAQGPAAQRAASDLVAEIRSEGEALLQSVATLPTKPVEHPAGKALRAKSHPAAVRGSVPLAEISRALGGLSPALLPDLSQKVNRTRTSKLGSKTQYEVWDNPPVPGVGPLFRVGGTVDLGEVARVLEEAGYLTQGTTEADGVAAGNQAADIIRAELARGGSTLRVGDAEARRRADEAMGELEQDPWDSFSFTPDDLDEAGYSGASDEVRAAVEQLLQQAESAGVDTETIREDVARALGADATDEAYHDAIKQAIQQAIDQRRIGPADTGAAQAGGEDRGQAAEQAGGARGEGRQGGPDQEGLTLSAQTPDDLKAKAEREAAARRADEAEQQRLERKARADAQRDEFTLTGSDRAADVAAAAGQGDIFGAEPDFMAELFGTPEQQAESQANFEKGQAAARAEIARLRQAISGEIERAQAEYNDWQGRSYKSTRNQVDLRGDGPSNREAVSIGSINEGRRRNAMEALSREIAELQKLEREASTDFGAEALASRMREKLAQAERAVGTAWATQVGLKTAGDVFQYSLLDELKFRGPGGKGNVMSNGLSKAMLSVALGGAGASANTETQAAPLDAALAGAKKAASKPETATKIEDFGEKLAGAKKDYATTLKDAMEVDAASEPLSKSWPEPDYQKLLDGGTDPFMVAFIHAARDEVPTKPQKGWKLKGWVDSVTALRSMSQLMLSGNFDSAEVKKVMARAKFDNVTRYVGGRAELYQAIGHEQSLKGVTFTHNHYSLYRGRSNVDLWVVEQKTKANVFGNWPREIATGDTKEEALAAFKEKVDTLNPKERQTSYDIYRKRNVDGYFIGKKIGREYVDLKKVADVKEARAFLAEHRDQLDAALAKYKDTPFERSAENAPRVGGDHRLSHAGIGQIVQSLVDRSKADAKRISDALVAPSSQSKASGSGQIPLEPALSLGPGDMNTILDKNLPYMASVASEVLRNLNDAGSLSVEGFSRLNAPARRIVQASMLALGHDPKIRRGVVQLVPVDVVNLLASENRSADDLLGNRAMLGNLLSVNDDPSVRTPNAGVLQLARAIARSATEGAVREQVTGVALKDDPAVRAGQFNSISGQGPFGQVNVSPEDFHETFSFRGVQFGNYVEQGRRQSDLNQAFDALMDMAAVLNLPPRALSLNGQLGLAFGARGSGGKNAAAAHFEPGQVVINLTKGNGPGSLAHEWWHAADNYFARNFGGGGFVTGGDRADQLRVEMQKAFKTVQMATQAASLRKRSQELDKRRSKPYWNTTLELSARSFEAYIIAKLQDQSAANGYLANVVEQKVWDTLDAMRGIDADNPATYPYPNVDEIPAVRAAFDEFFKTVQTRQDDAGNVAMFSLGANSARAEQAKARVQDTTTKITEGWSNAPSVRVIGSMDEAPQEVRAAADERRDSGAAGSPEGFWHNGTVYLVAEQLPSDADVTRVLFHEALGHAGLRGVFGSSLNTVLDTFAQAMPVKVAAKAAEYGLDMRDLEQRRQAAEEALAEISQTRPKLGSVQRLIAAVRTWLRENLPGLGIKMSDAEVIKNFVLPARGWVERGAGVASGDAAFSLASDKQKAVAAQKALDAAESVGPDEWAAAADVSFEAQQAFADKLAAIPDDSFALSGERRGRMTTVNPSAQNPGQYQVTRFDTKGEPWSDAQHFTKRQAIDDFLQSVDLASVQDSGGAALGGARFSLGQSLAGAMNSAKDVALPAGYKVADLFNNGAGKLHWWHKSVGTMHNLAERNPLFKRVYVAAQTFINDVSWYATEAANEAPSILPKLETWRDLGKKPVSAADSKAMAAPVFEGTLLWARDADGAPVKVDELQARADAMSAEDKARELMRAGHLMPEVLRMWQGRPIDEFEAMVGNAYGREFLQPGVVWSDAELQRLFGLNAGQIKLYREFRAATDKSLTHLAISDMLSFAGEDASLVRQAVAEAGNLADAKTAVLGEIDRLRNEEPDRADVLKDTAERIASKVDQVQRLIDRGYAPLMRFGNLTLDVVDPATGERLYFGMFEGRVERAMMKRKLEAEFPGAEFGEGTLSQEQHQLFQGMTPETLELFGDMLGLEAQGADTGSQLFQQYLKLAKDNRSAMKRLIHRKGVAGFSEDAGRVLASFVYSNARTTSRNLHRGELTRSAADIPKDQGELQDAALKLTSYVSNPSEEAAAIKGMVFANFLGGSVASALVNATQPVVVAMPYLSQWGGMAKAAGRMKQAVVDATKATTGDAELDAALAQASEKGIVSPQEVHQLMGQASGKATLSSGDGTKAGDALAAARNTLNRAVLAWGKVFSFAEQFNRKVTFIAAYRTAVAEGIADPAGFAEKAVDDTMFSYTKANRPRWARGFVGSLAFTFKTFAISYTELMVRMYKQGGPDGRRAALMSLATLALAAGVQGLPGADDLDDLIDGALQRLGYNFSSKQRKREFLVNVLGEGGADFVLRGVSGLPGAPIDVSGRLGLGNLIPGTGLLTKKTDYTRDVTELAGPAASMVTNWFKAGGKAIEGDFGGAALQALPSAAQNMAKAVDMMATGMYRDQKGRKVIDTDGYDAMAKFIGFQPTDVKRVQEATGMVQQGIALNKMREAEIAELWAEGRFEKDADKVREAMAMRDEWNRDNPESRILIKDAQIIRRVREMNMSKVQRIEKTAPKEIKAQVRAELESVR